MTPSFLRVSAAALLAAAVSFLLPAAAAAQTPGRSFRGAYDLVKPNDVNQQFVLFVGKNSLAYCVYADYANRSVGIATFAINSAGQFSFATNNGKTISGTFSETGVTGNATTFGAFSGTRQSFRTTGAQSAGCFNGWAWTTPNGTLDSITWIILPTGRTYVVSYDANGAVDGGVGTTQVDGTPSGRGTAFNFTFKSVLDAFNFSGIATLTEGVLDGSFRAGSATVLFSMPRENATYHLINLATRGFVNTGDGALIGGFVVSGGAKRVVIRALGPSLAAAGVAGVLSDPTLQVNAGSTVVVTNDNWRTDANSAQVAALGLAPSSDLESAVVLNLEPGAYTAIVRGAGSATGVALVEVYEVD